MSDQTPEDHDRWMIHALNIHGDFFEAWCRHRVESTPGWSLAYHRYPVEWPRRTGMMRGDESELDLRADVQHGNHKISLLIECKKNNPQLTEWVFFPKGGIHNYDQARVFELNVTPDAANNWMVTQRFEGLIWASPLVEEARETKGNFADLKRTDKDRTRTSNSAITDAARQVSIAYRAITHEETTTAPNYLPAMRPSYRNHYFVPVIVTTAHLHICQFDPADVSHETGEIPLTKAKLLPVPHVRYDYPLPPSLQWSPLDSETPQLAHTGWREPYIRQRILVIKAGSFPRLLNALRDSTTLNLNDF